jgi:8-oxo-dGTP diphosphatase
MDKKQYLNSLPRKRIASGAIIFNQKGELLMVKPSYKDYWSIPGGVVEKNESPYQACLREALEEIGIKIKIQRLVGVFYRYRRDLDDELIQFHYLCFPLSKEQIRKIKLAKDEIEDYKYVKVKDVPKYNQRLTQVAKISAKLAKQDSTNNYFEEFF